MLDGVMLLWFALTTMCLLFVAVDIRATPESPALKWGFVLLLHTRDPLALFFTYSVAANHCRDCMNAIWQCHGGRCWAPRCIVWRVMA